MFKPYESKPVTRMALQIVVGGVLGKVTFADSTYSYTPPGMEDSVDFKAYQEPVAGDWIVRLTDEDTYHCTDTVFRERNIVPGIFDE